MAATGDEFFQINDDGDPVEVDDEQVLSWTSFDDFEEEPEEFAELEC